MDTKQNEAEKYSQLFLVVLLIGVLYLCFLFLRPFLNEIIISAILVTIFYPAYYKIGVWFKGRMSLAALAMCLLIVLIVVIPLANLVYLIAQESVDTYKAINDKFSNGSFETILDTNVRKYMPILEDFGFDIKSLIVDAAAMVRDVFVSGATAIAKGTTQVIVSL